MMDQPDFDGNVLAVQVSLETGKVLHCVNLNEAFFPPDMWWAHSRGASLANLDFEGRYLFAQANDALGLTFIDLEGSSPSPVVRAPSTVWGISIIIQDDEPVSTAPVWTNPFVCGSSPVASTTIPRNFQYELTSQSYTVSSPRRISTRAHCHSCRSSLRPHATENWSLTAPLMCAD